MVTGQKCEATDRRTGKYSEEKPIELHITESSYSEASHSSTERLGRQVAGAIESAMIAARANACRFISRSTFAYAPVSYRLQASSFIGRTKLAVQSQGKFSEPGI